MDDSFLVIDPGDTIAEIKLKLAQHWDGIWEFFFPIYGAEPGHIDGFTPIEDTHIIVASTQQPIMIAQISALNELVNAFWRKLTIHVTYRQRHSGEP